jgi:ClpP class serine protease
MLAELDSLFNAEVAKNRPQLTLESIVNMKADAFLGNKALELGLIDGIVSSMDEVINLNLNSTTKRGDVMTLEELKAQLSAKDTELATLQASVTNTVAKAIADERARCIDILGAGQTLKITAEQVTKRISAGTAKEDAVDIFTAIADAIGTSTAIDTAAPVEATVSKNLTTDATETKVEIEGSSYSIKDIVAAAHAISKGVK